MEQKEYYQILGVPQNAKSQEIKEAYRQLAFKFHPDRNNENPGAADKMKTVNEAYAVLSNPAKRREYDSLQQQFGASAYSQFRKTYSDQDIFKGSDIQHVFEEVAKTFGFRGFNEIFKEFYGQGYQRFEYQKPGFFAKGFVFGGHHRTENQNQAPRLLRGNWGKISRHLFKKLSGLELPEDGKDTLDTIRLSPEQAIRGGPYAYFHRQKSKKLVVQIPPGIHAGQRIRLAGMGKDGKGGGNSGDLYLKAQIQKPRLHSIKHNIAKLFK
jgi:DnaJ-class molecular chaperone